jgi:uncharacterized RDD family membrane protein YckC
MNIRVVMAGGQPFSPKNFILMLKRNAIQLIPFVAIVELIIMIVNEDKPDGLRRISDNFAGTRVVKV